MVDSTYLQASNPSSMRDQGICRNTVYNMAPEADQNASEQYMAGNKEFMASSYQFAGEKERLGYVKASKGDRRVQGVIDYKNQDLYSFGGKRPITRAYREASNDLNDVACQGKYYFETVKSKEKNKVYEKEYHEEVNDYTKNIS